MARQRAGRIGHAELLSESAICWIAAVPRGFHPALGPSVWTRGKWHNQVGPPIRGMLRRRTSQAKQLSFALKCPRVIAVSRGPPSSWLASGVTSDPGLSSRAEIGILEGRRPGGRNTR